MPAEPRLKDGMSGDTGVIQTSDLENPEQELKT